MSKQALSFPLFDADNHLYETREALTKFLETLARFAVNEHFGRRLFTDEFAHRHQDRIAL